MIDQERSELAVTDISDRESESDSNETITRRIAYFPRRRIPNCFSGGRHREGERGCPFHQP